MSAKYEWCCVTGQAAFTARDGDGALVFRDRMWLLGEFIERRGGVQLLDKDPQ